jgi:hypothetical protein
MAAAAVNKHELAVARCSSSSSVGSSSVGQRWQCVLTPKATPVAAVVAAAALVALAIAAWCHHQLQHCVRSDIQLQLLLLRHQIIIIIICDVAMFVLCDSRLVMSAFAVCFSSFHCLPVVVQVP